MPDATFQPVLTVWTSDPGFEVGRGRNFFFGCTSQQVYALLWDPWIVSLCGEPPTVRTAGQSITRPRHTLLMYAHPTPESDIDAAAGVLSAGGCVLFNRPEPGVFDAVAALRRLGGPPPTLTSLRERWQLGERASRDYYYPAREPFYRLAAPPDSVLSRIGDNPDLVLLEGAGVFAGDPFAAMDHHVNVPRLDRLLLDLSTLLGDAVARLTGSSVGSPSPDHENLRRDFHAFGFAFQTVVELARCLGASTDCGDEAAQAAVVAAQTLARHGDASRADKELTDAFAALGQWYCRLEPHPAVFTDTLHAGGLHKRIGYFEFDWPQHTADVLRRHLAMSRHAGYRFNLDFAASSLAHLAERFPLLMQELRAAVAQGWVEFTHGTFNQPYPPLHPLESQLRQYDFGLAVFERVVGTRPRILASQEFAFSAQTPAMLRQYGYDGAVLRVQHFAQTPTVNEPFIRWASPDGRSIPTIPSHGDKSEQRNDLTYANLHLKLYDAGRRGVRPSLFSCMGDVTFYRPMREELARACRRMPALGRFATWSECFDKADESGRDTVRYTMDDFATDRLVMMNPAYGSAAVSGRFIEHGVRSQGASHRFVAAELLEVFAGTSGTEPAWRWEDLLNHQGHDTYIVPDYPAGGFMGGVTDPQSRQAGHAKPTVANYLGTWDSHTIVQTTGDALTHSEDAALHTIQKTLCRCVEPDPSHSRWAVYNASAARQVVVRLPGAGSSPRSHNGHAIALQKDGDDWLALVDLPAWSVTAIDGSGGEAANIDSPVHVGPCVLDNGVVRAEFDAATGLLTALMRCVDGTPVLAPVSGDACGGHRFVLSGEPNNEQFCRQANVTHHGPVRGGIEWMIELRSGRQTRALMRTCVTLDAGQSLLQFDTQLIEAPTLQGDQWENHLGVCFDAPDEHATWWRSHFNILEESTRPRLFSPNLVLSRGTRCGTVFINYGNAIYLRHGGRLCQLMLYENEPMRRHRYAIGPAEPYPVTQARAVVQPVYVEHIEPRSTVDTSGTPATPATPGSLATPGFPRMGWVHIDHPGVELLSCAAMPNGLRLRLANTSPTSVHATVRSACPMTTAQRTDFLGRPVATLDCRDSMVTIGLAPYEVTQIQTLCS